MPDVDSCPTYGDQELNDEEVQAMENETSLRKLCAIFGVIVIVLAGYMSAASASPLETENDKNKNNYKGIYLGASNDKDDTEISSVYRAKSILQIEDVKFNLTYQQF